jgi:hypothetical protein
MSRHKGNTGVGIRVGFLRFILIVGLIIVALILGNRLVVSYKQDHPTPTNTPTRR